MTSLRFLFLICITLLGACNTAPDKLLLSQLTAYRVNANDSIGEITVRTELKQRHFIYKYQDKPYTGKITDYYYQDLKNLKTTGEIKNGRAYGEWKLYARDGSLEAVGKFEDGNPVGYWIKYYPSGVIKVKEKYTGKNDTLYCDTVLAQFWDGRHLIEHEDQCKKTYYPNGIVRMIEYGSPVNRVETYNNMGVLISKKFDNILECYDIDHTLRKRTYYLQTGEGWRRFKRDKYNFDTEQTRALEHADSVEFDYTYKYDPVIKIYVR